MKQRHHLIGSLIILVSIFGAGGVLAMEPLADVRANPVADWFVGIVDGTTEVGYNVSIATDPETGHTYISYYDGDYGDLCLAWTGAPNGNCGPNNAWKCQVLDSVGTVGKYSSIAVGGPAGPFAKIYITYYDVLNGWIKVFEGEVNRETGEILGGSHAISKGDPNIGLFYGTETSVDLSETGTPHVAYQKEAVGEDAVMYAVRVAPGTGNCGYGAGTGYWLCGVVESKDGIGDYIDIDVGPGELPTIAFSTTHEGHPYPMIANPLGTGVRCDANYDWYCTKIRPDDVNHDTGEYLSFEITPGGEKQLAYRNSTAESLEWAKYVGPYNGNCGPGDDSYQCEFIATIGPGGSPAGIDMKIDSEGNPIIAYQDVDSGDADLKIARPLGATLWAPAGNCGPSPPPHYLSTWFCETLETGSFTSIYASGGLSIALNANDEAAVAYRWEYYDFDFEGRLKVALESGYLFGDGFESGDTSRWSVVTP